MGLKGYILLFYLCYRKGLWGYGVIYSFLFLLSQKGYRVMRLKGYELWIFFICFCHKTTGFRFINREGFSIKDRAFRFYPNSKSINIRIYEL